LRLDGGWAAAPEVLVDGQSVAVGFDAGVIDVALPAGDHVVEIKAGTTTSLAVSGIGSRRAISATVTDLASNSLAGATVQFAANSTTIGFALTDKDGVATLVAPPGYRGRDITFVARFEGNGEYSGSSDSTRV
jgi:hypothetical protein